MTARKHEHLESHAFGKLWSLCFSHVKVRAVKAVTGKCACCALLSHARKSCSDCKSREYITFLHALHRSMYMGERLSYYARRQEALQDPAVVYSLIGDGMAQAHCQLPYLAGMKTIDTLAQHLQGVLVHGQLMFVYRTFHNVNNSSNLQIHTFLLTIEYLITVKHNGILPETIYYQIDGGSENTAKIMYGIAELLVAKGVVNKLVLTRLPESHTHEDIDSKFPKIWVELRGKHVATMSEYKTLIEGALSSEERSMHCEVVDLFAIPDYVSHIAPCMDRDFGRYAKLEWTQLQWQFQKVDICSSFPLGVKTTYRAYAQDSVIEIIRDKTQQIGFSAQKCNVKWFPEANVSSNIPEGMFLLSRYPVGSLKPEQFVQGSRYSLEATLKKVRHHYAPSEIRRKNSSAVLPSDRLQNTLDHNDRIIAEWIHFVDNVAPLNDDAEDFCRSHPLHIPLYSRLFDTSIPVPVRATKAAKTTVELTNDLPVVKSTASVTWGNRGGGVIRKKRARVSVDEVSGESENENDSNTDDNDYVDLTDTQRKKYRHYFKYIDRQFEDKDEAGEIFEGTVKNIVMYLNKHVCFEYVDIRNSTQYIYAECLVESPDIKWSGEGNSKTNVNKSSSSSSSNQPQRSGWRGWVAVASDDEVQASLADEFETLVEVSATADGGRRLRSRK